MRSGTVVFELFRIPKKGFNVADKRYKQYLKAYDTREEAESHWQEWVNKLQKMGMVKMGYSIGIEHYQRRWWIVQLGPKTK